MKKPDGFPTHTEAQKAEFERKAAAVLRQLAKEREAEPDQSYEARQMCYPYKSRERRTSY